MYLQLSTTEPRYIILYIAQILRLLIYIDIDLNVIPYNAPHVTCLLNYCIALA